MTKDKPRAKTKPVVTQKKETAKAKPRTKTKLAKSGWPGIKNHLTTPLLLNKANVKTARKIASNVVSKGRDSILATFGTMKAKPKINMKSLRKSKQKSKQKSSK